MTTLRPMAYMQKRKKTSDRAWAPPELYQRLERFHISVVSLGRFSATGVACPNGGPLGAAAERWL